MRTSFLGKVHVMPSKYDPETRAKAVRLVLDHRDDYPSEWAAITAVSKRLGMNPRRCGTGSVSSRSTTGSVTGFPARLRLRSRVEAPQRRAGADDRNPQGGNVFLRAGERPALTTLTTAQVCAFIADHRDRFGVAPICRVLCEHGVPIAPRTFHAWALVRRRSGPCGTPPSPRFWPATTSPTSTAAANRSLCTGR